MLNISISNSSNNNVSKIDNIEVLRLNQFYLRQIIVIGLVFLIAFITIADNKIVFAQRKSKTKKKIVISTIADQSDSNSNISNNLNNNFISSKPPKLSNFINTKKNTNSSEVSITSSISASTIFSKFGTSKLVTTFNKATDINNAVDNTNNNLNNTITNDKKLNDKNEQLESRSKLQIQPNSQQPQIQVNQYNKPTSLPSKSTLTYQPIETQNYYKPYSHNDYQGTEEISAKIENVAGYYKLDPGLVKEIVRQESSFNPKAKSGKSAMGLMQMIPSTARRFGVKDPYDPDESLHGGCRYLVWLLRRFGGRLDLTLAGYNAGERAVEKYSNRVPPYKETQDYVRVITNRYLTRLQVKQAHLSNQLNLSNQLVKHQASYGSSHHKRTRGKGRSFDQNNNQYNSSGSSNSGFSSKVTKEKLDVLDSYFKKK